MTIENGKVTVSREVAVAIDYLTGSDNEETAIRYHAQGNQHVADLSSLNGLPLDTLIRALYIGYEVERSPEEVAAEYLRFLHKGVEENYGDTRWEDELLGAKTMLDKLGVKLPERTERGDAN